MKTRIQWINWAKFVAICAVLVDHSYGILYSNHEVAWASYFSVSLFIIVSGMTSYISNQTRPDEKWHETFWRTSAKMIIAYLMAAFLCFVMKTRSFHVKEYCIGVLKFNIQGPFYFVALYLQLMIINRILYNLVSKLSLKKNFLLGGCILIIATVTTQYTNILNIYGGGGKLFGGTYLFCYYIGMMFIKYDVFSDNIKRGIFFAVSGAIGYFVWWKFVCIDQLVIDSKLPFGSGMNPPGVSLFIMSILVLGLVYGLCMLLQRLNLNLVVDSVSWLGAHTLYIFLYHRAFLDVLSSRIDLENQILKGIICFGAMVIGPMLIEWMMKVVKDTFNRYILGKFSLVRIGK